MAAINTVTGTGTMLGPSGFGVFWGSAFAPSGTFYAIVGGGSNGDRLATMDLTTGAATVVSPLEVPLKGLDFAPDGTLYAADFVADSRLYRLNPATGDTIPIGELGFSMFMDMAFNSHGVLYAIASGSIDLTQPSRLYTIDLATGQGTLAASIPTPCLMSLAFDRADRLFAGQFCIEDRSARPLFEINLADGTALAVSDDTGIGPMHGGDIYTSTPEPGTWLSISSALALILWRRRRR